MAKSLSSSLKCFSCSSPRCRRTVSVHDIVSQSKSLCGQYIRSRLKRAGLFNRKLGLQRLRSAANLPGVGVVVGEVFGQLQSIGLELERMHPKLYSGICRQVSVRR